MSTISTDPETAGFDTSAGTRWIYPENYPRRDYQFTIVQTALYSNTLVCLPTGLGKTFIAAVVMYNFWRWYPKGRVVFMAPTKPLVAQQIHACHEIMGIPSSETIELTGAVNQIKRRQAWLEKRVIFATPQTFQKDLQNNIVPCELIKCIVLDEAHKALGKHSYCEIVRMLNQKTKFFRILALSATPGSKVDHVREVIQNLLISELELRDDTSPDITPYTNDRQIERIVVGLGKELNEFKERYIGIMDPHVRVLVRNHIMNGNTANISRGRIFMLMKQYDSKTKGPNHGTIMKTLNILLTMYHAYELLLKHGLRAFYNFYANHSDKFWLESELDLQLMLKDIQNYLGDFPIIQASPDEIIPDIPKDLVFGHNKFDKLRELLDVHFKSYSEQAKSTRAIVFVEYRDIVNEVYVLLLQNRPLIRPQMFVGQAGQKQRDQITALEDFRNNKVNVLISTSVGEEGLDVGEVDLIVCFDISTSAPTRLVQRMGRTGRKRSGRVVILLTEGKEMQTLNQAMSKKDSLNKKVLQSSNIASSLYQSSPRMVPPGIEPECLNMYIKSLPKTPKAQNVKKTKPPVEKKSRKKKDLAIVDNELEMVQPSTSKIDSHSKPVGSTQPTMMRFLTTNQQSRKPPTSYNQENDSGICEEFQLPINPDNPYALIRPTEVKILTSDSHALEFLTLCAMKKSEEGTQKSDIIRINKTWIPRRSPVDIFCNLVVPSIDDLDYLRDLTEYSGSLENELKSDDSDRSLSSPQSAVIKESDRSNNFFQFGNSYIESQKYDKDSSISLSLLKDFDMEDLGLFDEIPSPNKQVNNKSHNSILHSTEISGFDFNDDFSIHESPHGEPEGKKPEENDNGLVGDASIIEEFAQPSFSPQLASSRIPAHVEIDFENILDEETESEVSDARSVNGEANIFDDLINADSSTDDDLFPEDHNITVIPAKKEEPNITVVANSITESSVTAVPEQTSVTIVDHATPLPTKRIASQSPERVTPSKKQKIAETDSSDDEDVEILGTPQKERNRSFSQRDVTLKPVPKVADPDSDQDLFDDIDFDETQFSFADNAMPGQVDLSVALGKQDNGNKRTEEPTKPVLDNDESLICLGTEVKVTSQKDTGATTKKLTFRELDEAADEFHGRKRKDQPSTQQKSTSNKSVKSIDRASKVESDKNASGLDSADWNDDPSFAPFPSEEVNIIKEEKFSRFFKPTPKKSFSQEVSSTGWISTNPKANNNVIKPKSMLSLKTSNIKCGATLDNFIRVGKKPDPLKKSEVVPKFIKRDEKLSSKKTPATVVGKSTWSNDLSNADEEFESIFNKPISRKPKLDQKDESELFLDKFMRSEGKPNPGNNDPKIMSANCTTRPCLRLLALKKSVPAERDMDGFIMPQSKIVSPKAVTSSAVSNEGNKNGKENQLPRWIKSNAKKDICMSPRFRKYHSENDLSVKRKSKKRFKARKKLACDFIDDEAEVSSDADTTDGSSADEDKAVDDSFVSYTQDMGDSVDMRAHYLQTVNKSPIRPGGFMFKKTREVPDYQIYSQPISQSQANETYMNDSFCVGDDLHDSDNDCYSLSSDSLLDDIEYNLEIERESSKMKKKTKSSTKRKNRNNFKNISTSTDSSSEDEMEALRKQVLEESMLLKR
ncbi:hypothetical protein QAD02_008885 [Eretmocerus hayati]|uniref:Uncharacterized protein n=1 Tax=Eretmocerus hayati TaxID=131215 RepID=A0ACC2N7Y6_9HYME|nr:hypothetical protein QAD02_008885 [Eretmocerus hayati]